MDSPERPAEWTRGAVVFAPARGVLRVGGQSWSLDHRSTRLLSTLIERFGEIVSKDDLLEAAWPGRTVQENSLVKAMAKLRGHMLGSGLEIATAHGYGYVLRESAGHGTDTPPTTTIARPARKMRPAVVILAALAVAMAALVVMRPPTTTGVPVRTTPPETIDGPAARGKVLWVDDKPQNNTLDVAYLRTQRVAVHLARSTDEAMALLTIKDYDLVISDLGRGEDRLAGLSLIGAMTKARHDVPVLIYTIRPDDPRKQLAQNAMVFEQGASGLALTPQEVRTKSLDLLGLAALQDAPAR